MLTLAFLLGVTTSIACLMLGYRLGRLSREDFTPGAAEPLMPAIFGRGKPQRRKPKFVSEEEQWKKEQGVPPLDPGLG